MQPKISVIVPAFNEAKLLPRCLSSLQKQTFSKDQFEIIVVDNGSTDETFQVAKSFDVRVVQYPTVRGCGPARKYGATLAKGELVAFFDADAEALPEWLEKVEKVFRDESIVCVGGRVIPDDNSFWSKAIFRYYDVFHLFHHWIGKPIMGGYNMIIKKTAYDAVGGYDISLLACEDWDLSLRLSKKFGKKSVTYNTDLVIKASARKVTSFPVFTRYLMDYIQSYFNIMILGKKRVKPTFSVR